MYASWYNNALLYLIWCVILDPCVHYSDDAHDDDCDDAFDNDDNHDDNHHDNNEGLVVAIPLNVMMSI